MAGKKDANGTVEQQRQAGAAAAESGNVGAERAPVDGDDGFEEISLDWPLYAPKPDGQGAPVRGYLFAYREMPPREREGGAEPDAWGCLVIKLSEACEWTGQGGPVRASAGQIIMVSATNKLQELKILAEAVEDEIPHVMLIPNGKLPLKGSRNLQLWRFKLGRPKPSRAVFSEQERFYWATIRAARQKAEHELPPAMRDDVPESPAALRADAPPPAGE